MRLIRQPYSDSDSTVVPTEGPEVGELFNANQGYRVADIILFFRKNTRHRIAYWVVGSSVVFHGIVSVALGPMIFPDSVRYAPSDGFTPLIDVLGVHGSPAPLVQLMWRLPAPVPLVIQALSSGFAWGFVSCAGLAVIRSTRMATVWVAVLTAIFWSPLVVFSDATVLSEPLAISGSVACTAGAACLVSERARRAISLRLLFVVTGAGFAVAVLCRPLSLIVLGPITLVSFAIAWRKISLVQALIAVASVSAVLVYGSVLTANASQSPTEVYRAYNRLALRASPEWIEAAKHTGFSDCPELPSAQLISSAERAFDWFSVGPFTFRKSAPGQEVAARTLRKTHCAGIVKWLEAGHLTPLEQLVHAPRDTMNNFLADGPRFWLERSMGAGMSLRVQRAAPAVTLLYDVAAVMLLAGVAFRTWQLRRRIPIPVWSWVLVGVAFSSWFLYSLTVWLSDSSALGRVFQPVPIVLAPFALLTAVLTWPSRDSAEALALGRQ